MSGPLQRPASWIVAQNPLSALNSYLAHLDVVWRRKWLFIAAEQLIDVTPLLPGHEVTIFSFNTKLCCY